MGLGHLLLKPLQAGRLGQAGRMGGQQARPALLGQGAGLRLQLQPLIGLRLGAGGQFFVGQLLGQCLRLAQQLPEEVRQLRSALALCQLFLLMLARQRQDLRPQLDGQVAGLGQALRMGGSKGLLRLHATLQAGSQLQVQHGLQGRSSSFLLTPPSGPFIRSPRQHLGLQLLIAGIDLGLPRSLRSQLGTPRLIEG